MATKLNVSENQEKIPLKVSTKGGLRTITPDDGSPYYVGARAYVTQNVDGATVTVIDKDGTTTANIYNGTDGQDGQDGADGFSPIATVSKVGNTATITITDKNGTTTAEVYDGSASGASAFVAEFNVTTYADVKDAYDNDAILICTVDDSGNTMTLQLVYFDVANEIFYFAFPTSDGWYLTQLSNADGWGDGQFFFASTDVATQLADGLMSALDKQKLDGLSKRNIWYGTCSTSASSSPKSITTASGDFSLTNGSMLVVKFSNTNSLSSASLQVDGGTAKAVYQLDGTSNIANRWGGGEVVMFAYDGTKFILLDQSTASTTQYGITKLNNTVTSTSTSEAATANAVKSAYDNGGVQSVNGNTGAVTLSIHNVPSGGTSGQVLSKASGTDYDLAWSTPSSGSVTDVEVDGTSVVTGGVASIDLTGKSDVGHTHTKSAITDFPTTVSSFTNDAGYITGYTETDPVFSASAASGITSSDISDWNSKSEVSVTRHTTSGTNIADLTIDGTTTKLYAPTGGGGGITDVEVDGTSVVTGGVAEIDLTGKSDVGHTHTTSAITDFPSLATVATSGDYDDLTDKPTIPSKVSDLNNDSGFITSPNVVYCTCATEQSTVAKVATIVSGSLTTLTEGTQAIVKFTNANAATNPTLQVGSTAAKSIKRYGTSAPSTSSAGSWNGGSCIYFVYDGSDWQMIGFLNSTYSEISSTNIKSGSSSSTGLISGRRAKAAVEEFAPVKSVNGSTGAVTITVPTNLSDLNNDMDVSDFPNDAGYLTSHQDISGKADKTDTDINATVTTLYANLGWVAP